jgi:heat shock protein beta
MLQRPDWTLETVSPFCTRAFRYSHWHEDTKEEKDTLAALTEKYTPLLEWLKLEAGENVKDGE